MRLADGLLYVLRKRNLTVCFMGSKIEFDKSEFDVNVTRGKNNDF